MQAAGRQKYINRLQTHIAYLKNQEAVQAEKDRREALGVIGRAWQDAKNLTRSTEQQLANDIKGKAANVGQKVKKVKNVADKATDRAGGYLPGLFVGQNALKRNEARTKEQAQRAIRQKRIRDMQTEYRNLTKQQHYAERLSAVMQKQAYFKLMGYSEPAQNK